MAKAKPKPQPWDAVFEEVQVVRSPNSVCVPSATEAELDAVEKQLGTSLPASYREFMKRFGTGTLESWVGLYPLSPERGRSSGFTVTNRTLTLRKHYASKYGKKIGNHEWLGSLIYFANSGGGDEYAWDPAKITSHQPHECQFYYLPRLYEEQPVEAGKTFSEFIQWNAEHVGSWREQDPDAIVTPGFQFYRGILRAKKEPRKRNVKLWLAYNHNTARDLALSIRDRGQTDAFPILADALQEAGCTNSDLLDSCRTGDPEIDGKWVLSVLLGKA